jgi:adenosylcobinamide-GDP ribazoletransferase
MSKLFWAMLSFISRLPVPARWSQGLDFEHYSRGIVMFPLIGVVLGGLTGLVFMALQTWCGIPLAALCGADAGVIDRGFHLDGLADTCDGIFRRADASGCWKSCATVVWEPTVDWR